MSDRFRPEWVIDFTGMRNPRVARHQPGAPMRHLDGHPLGGQKQNALDGLPAEHRRPPRARPVHQSFEPIGAVAAVPQVHRGLRAPAVAIGDGALGFWSALRDVWPETTVQRDWCHKLANVLDKLPKRLRPRAKRALRDIMYAPVKADAERGIDAFVAEFEAKYPKAAACLAEDREALLAFFGFPAEHWLHLRTSNVIESVFATVRLRQRVTKGAGSRTKGLLMAYKPWWRWRNGDGAG